MLVLEKIQEELKKLLHVILVFLRNEVITGDVRNLLNVFPYTFEHEWLKLNHF